tara:strand:+ start:5942 stop:8053 length:2112 start_codon:yes stop_codon:yes gene_type:complete
MIKLIVEGQQLDLFKNEVFAISKSIAKIGDINLRHGDVSINFKVPATAKNNLIFRYISNLNNNNIGAFKRFEGVVLDGQSVISRGYYQVLKTKPLDKEIELRFYGGNSDWFDLIKDRSINKTYINESNNPNSNSYDLDYLNHAFTTDNIVSSWDNSEGYVYFPVDDSSNSTKADNVFVKNDFQLGVFQHTIIENMFNSINIKLKGNLFNDPLYYNTLLNLPTNIAQYEGGNSVKYFKTGGNIIADKVNYIPISFPQNNYDSQWGGGKFTSNLDIDTLSFELKYNGSRGTLTGNDIDLKIVHTIGLVAQPDIDLVLTPAFTEVRGGKTYINMGLYQSTGFVGVVIGDTFEFLVKENNAGIDDWTNENNVTVNGIYSNSFFQFQIEGSDPAYNVTDVLPEINQATFIKDVMFRFGCVSQYDASNRTLSIDKFDVIEDNKNKGIDFTTKVDLSKGIDIDFTKLLQSYFKTTYIKYVQDDNDSYNILNKNIFKIGLGDGEINIDNDNLSDEGTIYESVFAATSQVWTLPASVDGTNDLANFYLPVMSLYDGSGEPRDLKPRLFVWGGKIPVTQFSKNGFTKISLGGNDYFDVGYSFFTKEILEDAGVVDKGLNGNLDTQSFQHYEGQGASYMGNTLLSKYYSLQSKILNTPIFLSINLNLNDLDMESIDFLTPIWIETQVDSGYYYINEISQYKGDGSTTKVNLVKI